MPRPAVRQRYGLAQARLETLFALREQAKEQKAQLKVVQDMIDEYEKVAIEMLEAGATVEPGHITPLLRTESRRIVKWKEEYVKEAGFEKAQKLIEATQPHTHQVLDLVATD